MSSDSLTHDVAWATTQEIVRVFAGCLREEEPGDALDEVYPLVKAGLERFQLQLKRMQRRMRPGAN